MAARSFEDIESLPELRPHGRSSGRLSRSLTAVRAVTVAVVAVALGAGGPVEDGEETFAPRFRAEEDGPVQLRPGLRPRHSRRLLREGAAVYHRCAGPPGRVLP